MINIILSSAVGCGTEQSINEEKRAIMVCIIKQDNQCV